ncbi:MAG: hypothetical protein SOY42_14160 [Clostridium sp.]|nr:hypothetical protein [Clostridium sp.]
MKTYKVIDITEQDFGCEELPEGQKYCVDVILQDNETNENITISVPDAELYEKCINIGTLVYYDGRNISKTIV